MRSHLHQPSRERRLFKLAGPANPDRTFAFVLVDLGAGVNITAATAMNRMINDPNSIRNYYLYDSYGRQNISAQVFSLSYPAFTTTCNTTPLATALRPMVPGTFQHYLWYFGQPTNSVPSWAGLASVGTAAAPSKDTWYNASSGCTVLVQEPGHNFGMQHSSSIRCTGAPMADDTMTCTASEYGDVFDPMGSGCRHMNAWQKAYQGWFGGCNGVTVTASGTFKLLPYEMRCDGAQFLQIAAPKSRTIMRTGGGGAASIETLTHYFVELRTPLDFETAALGGNSNQSPAITTPRVLLHIANDLRTSNQRAIHPYLIDMTPATTTGNGAGFADSALAVGQTFTDPDPAGGLTITAVAVSATEATIQVTIPGGGAGAPTCLDNSTFPTPNPGPESCMANTPVPTGTPAAARNGRGARDRRWSRNRGCWWNRGYWRTRGYRRGGVGGLGVGAQVGPPRAARVSSSAPAAPSAPAALPGPGPRLAPTPRRRARTAAWSVLILRRSRVGAPAPSKVVRRLRLVARSRS